MKTRLTLFILALCGAFATTSALGQNFIVWSGASDGTNLANAANWVGGVNPNTGTADVAIFDSTTQSNLNLICDTATYQSGPGQSGIWWTISTNHIGNVSIGNTLASPAYFAVQGITNNGAGSFTLGDTNPAYIFWVIGRPNGFVHPYVNNSTFPAIIAPWTRFAAGGGAAWTFDFSGTGDWYCQNYLCNDNGPGITIQVDGPGTMHWNPIGFVPANGVNSPIVINGGTMVLQAPHPKIAGQNWTLGGTFEVDTTNQTVTLSGVFSGAGTNIVKSGTLVLSGASTYTGDTILRGGELIVNGAESPGVSGPVGNGGTIRFQGGTLGFTVNDNADYSARFDTNNNQAYSFDTGGQTVAFGAGLTSSGGTLAKLGPGTLALDGTNTYTGNTTVSGGRLTFGGPMSGTGNVSVADGAIFAVTATATQVKPGTLTVGTSGGASLGFFNVSSTTTAPLAPTTLASSGPITVNVYSGTFSVNSSYPLFTWTSGAAPAVQLGVLTGFIGNLSTNGNTIQLNVTGTAYTWTGAGGGNWDFTSANNWIQNSVSKLYVDGVPVIFDDTAVNPTVSINAAVHPSSVTFNNTIKSYTLFDSSFPIAGTTGLTKSGTNSLLLVGALNSYTGPTTISGGVLSIGSAQGLNNGGLPSDIGAANNNATNLVFDGGALVLQGGDVESIDRLFTLTANGGTIDVEAGTLNFTNPGPIAMSGPGARTLTLTGIDPVGDTLAGALSDSGGPTAVSKTGTGLWILTGTNSHSGQTTISGGTLQVGNGGATGSLGSGNVANSGRLVLDRTGNMTVSGTISGGGGVTVQGGGTFSLSGHNSYSGGTTVGTNTTLQLTGSGSLNLNANIVNNGTFVMNSSTPLNISGFNTGISGTGNVIISANRTVSLIDYAAFSGWLLVNSGATFQPCYGNEGVLNASVVTNNGTLLFLRQDNNAFIYTNNIVGSGKVVKDNNNANTGDITLEGTGNDYTGGTWIEGGGVVLGGLLDTNANPVPGSGTIVGNVYFTNTPTAFKNYRYLTFNRGDAFTFSGNIVGAVSDSSVANSGHVTQAGTNVLILTGNNTYVGGTDITNGGTIQVGNGGTTGDLGGGNVTDNGTLVFDRSDAVTFTNAISGGGSVVQFGSGTVTLTAGTNNTYLGNTVVSNGTLVIGGESLLPLGVTGVQVPFDLDMFGGTLVVNGSGSTDTLLVGDTLSISNGILMVALNKSLAASNTVYFVNNTVIASGGTVKLVNYGPNLVVGDRFQVFSTPVNGGTNMTIVSPGATFTNHLSLDGSVTVTSVTPLGGQKITAAVSGGQLSLSWPTAGVVLQVQTNTLTQGLGTNWVTIPGTDSTNSFSVPVNKGNGSVFYRLAP